MIDTINTPNTNSNSNPSESEPKPQRTVQLILSHEVYEVLRRYRYEMNATNNQVIARALAALAASTPVSAPKAE